MSVLIYTQLTSTLPLRENSCNTTLRKSLELRVSVVFGSTEVVNDLELLYEQLSNSVIRSYYDTLGLSLGSVVCDQ